MSHFIIGYLSSFEEFAGSPQVKGAFTYLRQVLCNVGFKQKFAPDVPMLNSANYDSVTVASLIIEATKFRVTSEVRDTQMQDISVIAKPRH